MLEGTPYLLDAQAASNLGEAVAELEARVRTLRAAGKLTPKTLEAYYGGMRFEQVTESNALEGSPLGLGETIRAIEKGVTIASQGYEQDAQGLYKALLRLEELARVKRPTDIQQLKELHELVLGSRHAAGVFRNEPVRISGSDHKPPPTWKEVMSAVEHWDAWSQASEATPPAIRSTVLHAWLAHIHPFIDGNGRTARAIGNLELIRAGYPPLIIRRNKDKIRYIDALQSSDRGDLGPLLELLLARMTDSLRDLERAAQKEQSYDAVATRVKLKQEANLAVWLAGVDLLATLVNAALRDRLASVIAVVNVHRFADALTVDDYVTLCERHSIGAQSWSFRMDCQVPGLARVTRLAWMGYRSEGMLRAIPGTAPPGPSLFWSAPNPTSTFPPWTKVESAAPGGHELSLVGDTWYALTAGKTLQLTATKLADKIATDLLEVVA